MSNLNHMICPLCGHDFYCEAAYGKCDACQCVFYASQSKTSQPKSDWTSKIWFPVIKSAASQKGEL